MRVVDLPSGTLRLELARQAVPLDALCAFATRRNPRRGFLFVSRVLGRHLPAVPGALREAGRALLDQAGALRPPVAVLAMAETAVGFGHLVHEELWARTGGQACFIHTTRHDLGLPALEVREDHSHAPLHRVVLPVAPAVREAFLTARSVVLVDDEVTTGRTLAALAEALGPLCPDAEPAAVLALLDWSGGTVHGPGGATLPVHALVSGRASFEPAPSWTPPPRPDLGPPAASPWTPARRARAGCLAPIVTEDELAARLAALRVAPGERVLVLGGGEFCHPPHRLAEALVAAGAIATVQAWSRSPILPGGPITSVVPFLDPYGEGVVCHVYNLAPRMTDRIIACFETPPERVPAPLADALAAAAPRVDVVSWA